jgi:hypothetical protein
MGAWVGRGLGLRALRALIAAGVGMIIGATEVVFFFFSAFC